MLGEKNNSREVSLDEHIESLLPEKSKSSDIPGIFHPSGNIVEIISEVNSIYIAKWLVCLGVGTFFICLVAALGKISIPELRGDSVIGCTGWMLLNEEVR